MEIRILICGEYSGIGEVGGWTGGVFRVHTYIVRWNGKMNYRNTAFDGGWIVNSFKSSPFDQCSWSWSFISSGVRWTVRLVSYRFCAKLRAAPRDDLVSSLIRSYYIMESHPSKIPETTKLSTFFPEICLKYEITLFLYVVERFSETARIFEEKDVHGLAVHG